MIIHTILNMWETPGIEPVTSDLTSVYQISSSTNWAIPPPQKYDKVNLRQPRLADYTYTLHRRPIIVIYDFFSKIGIFLKCFNHADIGMKIFVGAAAWAKLAAAACSTGTIAAVQVETGLPELFPFSHSKHPPLISATQRKTVRSFGLASPCAATSSVWISCTDRPSI